MMRALAITGPRDYKKHLLAFQSVGEDSLVEFRILQMPDALTVSRTIASFRPELILIFGGDGTLHRHLEAVVASATPVLVVPRGSGNDFAKANGIHNTSLALELWRNFVRADLNVIWHADVGVIAATAPDGSTLPPRYFACCANIGLDADAARRTNHLPNWVKASGGYFVAALASLVHYQPQMISIQAEGANEVNISEVGWFVSISNTPTYGGGLKIAPQASIMDGRLDITFLPRSRFTRLQLLRHLPKILSGSHINLTGIRILTATKISVTTKASLPIYADAEYVGQTPCQVSTAPGALSVLRFLPSE